MAKNDTGVYQLPNKNWGFRYVLMVNGERKEARKTKDEFGAPFKTKREAIKARQAAIEAEQNSRRPKPTVRKTVAEVYQEYCEKGRSGKAYNTIRKQESLWVNHLCAAFGKRYIDEISAAEVVDSCCVLLARRGTSRVIILSPAWACSSMARCWLLILLSPCSYSKNICSAPAAFNSRTCLFMSCLLSLVEQRAYP